MPGGRIAAAHTDRWYEWNARVANATDSARSAMRTGYEKG
jgi:hypothetical protein